MNHINKLIQQYCPNGVEMVKLGDVCTILDSRRKPISKSKRVAGPYPYYGANGIQDYVEAYLFDGEYLLIGEDGSVINADGSPVINWATGKFWVNNHAHIITGVEEVSSLRYLYHALKTKDVTDLVHGVPPKLNQENLRSIIIPLPPLPVQEEIVRILDAMSGLVDELDEEIKARQKQYEHHREELLTFGEEVERVELGTIGVFIKGNGIQKCDFVEVGKPCIHYGQIHTFYGTSATRTKSFVSPELYERSRCAEPGDLVIASTSEDVPACCKACAWLGNEPVAVSGDAHIYHHTQNPKYMAYLFQTNEFFEWKKKAATGAKVTRVSGDSMARFAFRIPPRSVQHEIVEKLDAFESLIQNLAAERDLRQKQYEYYREKLLTF